LANNTPPGQQKQPAETAKEQAKRKLQSLFGIARPFSPGKTAAVARPTMFGMSQMSPDIQTFRGQYDTGLMDALQQQSQQIQPAPQNPWQLPSNINVTLTQAKPPGLLESILQNPMLLQLLMGVISNIASFGGRRDMSRTNNQSNQNIWQADQNPWDWENIKRGYDAKEFVVRMIKSLPILLASTSIGSALGGTTMGLRYSKYTDFSDDDDRKRLAKAITFGILAGAGAGMSGGLAASSVYNII